MEQAYHPQPGDQPGYPNAIPKGRSEAHLLVKNKKVVYLSFDIETGGDLCGIIQMSGELVRFDLEGTTLRQDKATNILRVPDTFNEYVNPGASAIWNEHLLGIHGLSASDQRIISAGDMMDVWGRFLTWLHANTTFDETVILVAWNGASCDLKWLWKITQAP